MLEWEDDALGSKGPGAAARSSEVGPLGSSLSAARSLLRGKGKAHGELRFSLPLLWFYSPLLQASKTRGRADRERNSAGSGCGVLKGTPLPFSFSIILFSQ